LNLRPRGYEPRELPLLHPASNQLTSYQTEVRMSIALAMEQEVHPRLEIALVGGLLGL
jgi:hypothetical protein